MPCYWCFLKCCTVWRPNFIFGAMSCLVVSRPGSHLSRFVFDMAPPKIESFISRIVATKSPRATRKPRRRGTQPTREHMTWCALPRHAADMTQPSQLSRLRCTHQGGLEPKSQLEHRRREAPLECVDAVDAAHGTDAACVEAKQSREYCLSEEPALSAIEQDREDLARIDCTLGLRRHCGLLE